MMQLHLLPRLTLPSNLFQLSCRLCSALQTGQKASISKTITQDDVDKFIQVSEDSNPVHQGPNAVVHGAFLNSLVSCVMGTKVPGPGCMVVSQTIKYPNPCHVGEFVDVCVNITGLKMDLIKCRYTIMAKPNENSSLAESKLVLSGEANLIKFEDQKKRVKKKQKVE